MSSIAAVSIRLYNDFWESFSSFICSRYRDHHRSKSHTAAFRRGEIVAPFLPFWFCCGMKTKAPWYSAPAQILVSRLLSCQWILLGMKETWGERSPWTRGTKIRVSWKLGEGLETVTVHYLHVRVRFLSVKSALPLCLNKNIGCFWDPISFLLLLQVA